MKTSHKEYSFERLQVWQKARLLVSTIYDVSNNFPAEEKFGLTSQMRRCSISIASNIAEGVSRRTNNDKRHFLNMAFGSLIELLNQLVISADLEYINNDQLTVLRIAIDEVGRMLHSLRESFR